MAERPLAPVHIVWAIAYYVSPEPEEYLGRDHFGSPVGGEMRDWLLEEGLIDAGQHPTPRLETWIQHLCKQPLPELAWIVPAQKGAPDA